jgi:hypothetical protein
MESQRVELMVAHQRQRVSRVHHRPYDLQRRRNLRAPVNVIADEEGLPTRVAVAFSVRPVAEFLEQLA